MPLSEHEQRVLHQMEQALYAEDPRLASQLQRTAAARTSTGLDRRRLAIGVLGALAGLTLVVVGVMSQYLWISIIGFLAMVLGGAWAATPARRGSLGVVAEDGSVRVQAGSSGKPGQRGKPKSSGGFMSRMEQQWDKRREQGP